MTAYYNEFDPKTAAWLRELIARNLIAPGEVDERSITEVAADDLKGFTQCHFFAGIGGWAYALRLAGWPDDRPVWTGSCPCPPFSSAGKRQACQSCKSRNLVWCPRRTGYAICADCGHAWLADPRHLFPELWRLIAECRPAVVFGEQVASADGLVWLAGVRPALEICRYDFGAADYPAAGVGAPNIRQRLWWVAYAQDPDGWSEFQAQGTGRRGCGPAGGSAAERLGNTPGNGYDQERADAGRRSERGPAERRQQRPGCDSDVSRLGDTEGTGLPQREHDARSLQGNDGTPARQGSEKTGASGRLAHPDGGDTGAERQQRGGQHGLQPQDGIARGLADPDINRAQRQQGNDEEAQRFPPEECGAENSADVFERGGPGLQRPGDIGSLWPQAGGGMANTNEFHGDGERHGAGHDGGQWIEPSGLQGCVHISGFWDDFDLIGCTDGKARRVGPGITPLAHGIPARMVRLRGYGNAINPVEGARFIIASEGAKRGAGQ